MKERLKMVRKAQKLTQEQFAVQLGLAKNFIYLMESGKNAISDRTIRDVCRIFGVNETWLRTGEGEMNGPASKEADIASITMQMFNLEEDSFRYQLQKYVSEMPDDQLEVIKDMVVALAESIKEKK